LALNFQQNQPRGRAFKILNETHEALHHLKLDEAAISTNKQAGQCPACSIQIFTIA
jgi:hypothetical protein